MRSLYEEHGTCPSQHKEITNIEENGGTGASMTAAELNLPSPAKTATATLNQHGGNWEEDAHRAGQGNRATAKTRNSP